MKLKHTHIWDMKKDLHILSFFFQRVINIYDIHFLVDFIYIYDRFGFDVFLIGEKQVYILPTYFVV